MRAQSGFGIVEAEHDVPGRTSRATHVIRSRVSSELTRGSCYRLGGHSHERLFRRPDRSLPTPM